MIAVLVLGFPVLVTLVPTLAGRWASGRPRTHRVELAILALAGVALGAWLLSGQRHGVSDSQALEGAVLGGALLVLLPAAAFLELGYRARSRVVIAVVWVCSIVPVAIYLFIVALGVQNDIECPTGETCPIFS